MKYRKGDQIIQTFCKIGSPEKLAPPLFNLYQFENPETSTPASYKMHSNLMNDEEFPSKKVFKLEKRRGDQIIQTFCKIGSPSPPEIRYPFFNLYTFQDSSKSTPESCRIHWNVMNDEDIGSRKLLKLKYRSGDQIIQTFCKIGSPEKLGPSSLICTNLKSLRQVHLHHTKCTEI